MCFYTNIEVYNSYSNKIEKVLKKNDLQLGPKCPSATWEKNYLRNPSHHSSVHLLDMVCERGLVRTWWAKRRPPTRSHVNTSAMSSSTESTFSLWHCYSIYQRLVSCFKFLLTSTLAANKTNYHSTYHMYGRSCSRKKVTKYLKGQEDIVKEHREKNLIKQSLTLRVRDECERKRMQTVVTWWSGGEEVVYHKPLLPIVMSPLLVYT